MIETPHYSKVPKGFVENLRFRRNIYNLVQQERDPVEAEARAAELRRMCAQDILFYFNTFCWTYDPRRVPPALPFITYEYQDEAILELAAAIRDGHDVGIEKSRDMGASWICILVMEWYWHFFPLQSFLFVSRIEDYVYKSGDMKALFQKLQFCHDRMPTWMFDKKPTLNKLHLRNNDNGSTIDGEATTGDVGRGDRRTAILLDEFAAVENKDGYRALSSTRDVTNCRVFNSTPQGASGAYVDMITKPSLHKIRMHWTQHPIKSQGLYHDGKGKPRSPWYDDQCERAASEAEIRQELDIDYGAADSLFFNTVILEDIEREICRPPAQVGELDFQVDSLDPLPEAFQPRDKGRLSLWTPIGENGKPPDDTLYFVACDIATGTGASNSTISVGAKKSGEKVAAFVSPNISPHELAHVAIALCKWFHNAQLGWEVNGPGQGFSKAVMEFGYGHLLFRRNEASISKKITDTPGWHSNPNTKVPLLQEYRRALQNREFLNRSKEAVAECRAYVYCTGDGVAHTRSLTIADPSGAKANHGDRVIADAICWKMIKEVARDTRPKQQEALPGTFAHRRKLREAEERRQDYW